MNQRPSGPSISQIAHFLQGLAYPSRKPELMAHAVKNGAGREVLAALEGFPEREYVSVIDIMDGFAEAVE